MPTMPPVPSTLDTSTPIRGAALAAILAELAAMPESDVMTPRVDVPAAVLTVIGSAPKIEVHRGPIAALFGADGTLALDRLVPLARGLNVAQGEYVATTETGLEHLADELAEVRTQLATDAEILVRRKILEPNALSGLAGGLTYLGRIGDITALVSMFRMKWRTIEAQTKVTLADLDRAEHVTNEFQRLLGERDQASSRTTEAGRLRARAFTLFFRNYDHVRQMLTLLRWHEDDADEIAPSLYAGRTRSRTDRPDPVTPAPVTGNPISPGMPGSDPFPT